MDLLQDAPPPPAPTQRPHKHNFHRRACGRAPQRKRSRRGECVSQSTALHSSACTAATTGTGKDGSAANAVAFELGNYRNYYGYRYADGSVGQVLNDFPQERADGGRDAEESAKANGGISPTMGTVVRHDTSSTTRRNPAAFSEPKGRKPKSQRAVQGSDGRLELLQPSWFHGKDCLDIGCNAGAFSAAVLRRFGCASMLGIDADAELIRRARASCELCVDRQPCANGACAAASVLPSTDAEENPDCSDVIARPSLRFECMNVMDDDFAPNAKFDVVMCMSVTKWIHYHHGDSGVRNLFRKVQRALKPGGLFLLEPQPWRSYKKKQRLTPAIHRTVSSIRVRPNLFPDILVKECGFEKCISVGASRNHAKGFRRPIYAVWKTGASVATTRSTPITVHGTYKSNTLEPTQSIVATTLTGGGIVPAPREQHS